MKPPREGEKEREPPTVDDYRLPPPPPPPQPSWGERSGFPVAAALEDWRGKEEEKEKSRDVTVKIYNAAGAQREKEKMEEIRATVAADAGVGKEME